MLSFGNLWRSASERIGLSASPHILCRQFLGRLQGFCRCAPAVRPRRRWAFPVKVLKKDRQTPVGGEWFCINFGNRKAAIAVPESTSLRDRYIRPKEKGWFPKATIKDGDIAVSKTACSGPDIWIDPQVGDAFFLSDGLGNALKKAKADKGFFLHKCRVL
jgi:hypothetical protein